MPIRPCLTAPLLRDISALNRRFMAVFVDAALGGRFAADADLVRRLSTRLSQRRGGWPDCPFLLYRIVLVDEAADATRLDPLDPGVAALVTVSLGFVWQLAREHPPAARAVAGADADWCDALAAMDIAQLSLLAGEVTLRPRLVDVPGFWQDLARRRGISSLQRASLGATGMQLIQARARRARVAREWSPPSRLGNVADRRLDTANRAHRRAVR